MTNKYEPFYNVTSVRRKLVWFFIDSAYGWAHGIPWNYYYFFSKWTSEIVELSSTELLFFREKRVVGYGVEYVAPCSNRTQRSSNYIHYLTFSVNILRFYFIVHFIFLKLYHNYFFVSNLKKKRKKKHNKKCLNYFAGRTLHSFVHAS